MNTPIVPPQSRHARIYVLRRPYMRLCAILAAAAGCALALLQIGIHLLGLTFAFPVPLTSLALGAIALAAALSAIVLRRIEQPRRLAIYKVPRARPPVIH